MGLVHGITYRSILFVLVREGPTDERGMLSGGRKEEEGLCEQSAPSPATHRKEKRRGMLKWWINSTAFRYAQD